MIGKTKVVRNELEIAVATKTGDTLIRVIFTVRSAARERAHERK